MPWLVGTAFLHSVIIQERYGMLKVWNVFLICLTFFMTIFGTFLTRSGLIASVHSFARSDIGIWFIYYLVFLFAVCVGLVVWRLPKLKAEHKIDSLVSREFAFLLNNWMFLAFMFAVLGFTMAPLISEWIYGSEITVGPAWYNHWLTPAGLILLFLAGVGPLLSWRKATGKNLMRAFLWPTVTGVVVIVLHFALGGLLGFPAVVEVEPIFDTRVGDLLAALKAVAPVLSTFTCAFVTATIVQEFWRGAAVRVRSKGENPFTAVVRLTSRARRRYGGYIVHVGIVVMYLGFTGAAWDVEKEAALRPGETLEVSRLGDTSRGKRVFRYEDVQMDADRAKRMVFTRMEVLDGEGDELGHVSPAKFIYRTMPEQPTTEVAIRSRPSQDLYVIMSTVDSRTKRGTFRVLLRPLVMWIWIGGLLLIFGTLVAAWPTAREIISGGSSKRGGAGKAAAAAAALLMALGFASGPSIAEAQDSSSLHAGSVVMKNSQERKLFERLLCMCGDCARLPLDTCGCSWAERARVQLRGRLSSGDAIAAIMKDYRKEHGDRSIAIPPDEGLGRVMWVVPVVAGALAAGGVVALGRRWRRRGQAAVREDDERDRAPARSSAGLVPGADADDYDARLDEELRQMEDEP
jgi:cytochrome c-type biogenesis protein CcmF